MGTYEGNCASYWGGQCERWSAKYWDLNSNYSDLRAKIAEATKSIKAVQSTMIQDLCDGATPGHIVRDAVASLDTIIGVMQQQKEPKSKDE